MEPIETELYGLEQFENEGSKGYRLFSSHDRLWEARDHERGESRIYQDDGTWYAKVRFPETDDEAAWDDFDTAATRIEEAYDIDLSLDQRAFHKLANDERGGESADRTALTYRNESDIDLEMKDIDRKLGLALLEANYLASGTVPGLTVGATSGAVSGFLLGSPGGPAGAAMGAVMGGLFGGTIGTMGTIKKRIDDRHEPFGIHRESNRSKKKQQYAEKATDLRERWLRRKDTPDKDLLDDINRRNALQHILSDGDYEPALNNELDELEAKDLDEQYDRLMDITFNEFEYQPGVIAVQEIDSYEEALSFVQTVVQDRSVTIQEPSLYGSNEAFSQLFMHLVEDGDLSDDAEQLVRNLFDADNAETEVEDWVSENYDLPDDVERDLLL